MRHKADILAEDSGLTVRLEQDETPDSPRDWDNLGTMVCWHRRYQLGDKHEWSHPSDFKEWWENCTNNHGEGELLSLYLYDHSGISMSTGRQYPFDCPWDSGQVGYIYVTADKIREEYGPRITAKVREKVRAVLQGEVDTYDQFLRGEVYGHIVEGPDGEDIDSCWGYFGYDYAKGKAMSALKYQVAAWGKAERDAPQLMAL